MRGFDLTNVKFDSNGLVPVIVQHAQTQDVLMLGYSDSAGLSETLSLGKLVFFSRSRNQRWLKGETSGNFLNLVSLHLDCDSDAVLAMVEPVGPTCHTGADSCFEEPNGIQ